MGRFLHHLDTVLNAVFIVSAAGAVIFAVLSLLKGPTLHYAPYILAFCGIYYLGAAVKVTLEGGQKSVIRGISRLILALAVFALSFITYRSVA